jgi:hypothetical protein
MRPRRLGRWLFGLAAGLVLAVPPAGFGQATKPTSNPVKFETADGVTIKGTFYPGKKGADAACVLLLHELRGSSQQKGYDELAKKFQAKGFAVLKFDFRGHGKSTGIDPKLFWKEPTNRSLVKGWNITKPHEKIEFKDMRSGYYPNLVNDIAAAKAFLDKRNDDGECNSSNMVLVGAGTGATLGALWLKGEWYRHQITGMPIRLGIWPFDERPEGKDVVCAVWLSFNKSLDAVALSPTKLLVLGKDKKIPSMAFVYGDQDKEGERLAKGIIDKLDPRKKEKQFYASKAIRESKRSKGRELLSGDLETADWVVAGVSKVLEDKGLNEHKKKRVEDRGYVWAITPYRQILAKERDNRSFMFIPWTILYNR